MRNLKKFPLKLGILGCGSFVMRRILPFLKDMETIKVVCIQKRNLEMAKEIAAKFNIANAVTSREELLQDPNVEAVFIATPNHLHEQDAIACAAHYKPTLCEKPLAPNVPAILRMQAAFANYSTPLYVGHSLRFKPCVQQAKNIFQSKKLGQLQNFHAHSSLPIPKENWRYQTAYGGGALQEQGVHLIDLIRFVTGEEIISIFATANAEYRVSGLHADQTTVAVCRMESGALASFECSFIQPFSNGFEIIGSESRLMSMYSLRQAQPHETAESFYHIQKDDSTLSLPLRTNNIFVDELMHFAQAVNGEIDSLITSQVALQNQKVIDAGYLSMQQQKLITLR